MANENQKSYVELRRNLAIAGSIVAIGVLIYILILKPEGNVAALAVEFFSSIIVGLFVIFIWGKINDGIYKNEKEYVIQSINDALKGLRLLDIDQAFEKAANHISQCNEIRVIGTTKQWHHSGAIKSSIEKYLNATLKRLEREESLVYRRITSDYMEKNFQDHLEKCFSSCKNKPHDFSIMMMDDFAPAYTYLIIDDTFLMLSLNHPHQSSSPKNHSVFFTEDKEIISRFTEHFKSLWAEEERTYGAIRSLEDFKFEVEFKKKLDVEIKAIKSSINSLPKQNRLYYNHVLEEVKQTAYVLDGIAKGELQVNHTMANGTMIKLFSIYFSALNEGDTYDTITFRKFWSVFLENQRDKLFITKNKEAIEKGVIITRTLIIPKSFLAKSLSIADEKSLPMYREIIEKNIELINDLPTETFKKNYKFRILFSANHDKLEQNYYNFALIQTKSKEQKIVFSPSNTPLIGGTKMMICDMKSPRSKDLHMGSIEDSKEKLKEIYNEWKKQNRDDLKYFIDALELTPETIDILFYNSSKPDVVNRRNIVSDNSSFE
jgi:hypothetical protein